MTDEQQPERAKLLEGSGVETHVAECGECAAGGLPVERLDGILRKAVVQLDATDMAQRTLLRLQPEMARLASAAFWRRVVRGVVLALLPLPLVLAYDAWVLRIAYGLISALLPSAVALYLVASYAAFVLFLCAATYAAIPLLVAQESRARQISPA
jgi:anti-sigma factor RsiW